MLCCGNQDANYILWLPPAPDDCGRVSPLRVGLTCVLRSRSSATRTEEPCQRRRIASLSFIKVSPDSRHPYVYARLQRAGISDANGVRSCASTRATDEPRDRWLALVSTEVRINACALASSGAS